jgi:uncharacterized alkaline shock family protein YloU
MTASAELEPATPGPPDLPGSPGEAGAAGSPGGHGGQDAPGSPPGRTSLGLITLNDRVMEKVAACAAAEVPDAGSSAPRMLRRSLAGTGALGTRQTSLTGLPKVSADVDGSTVALDLSISVRWPASVPAVTRAVRDRVRHRVRALTGMTVLDVDISVTDLVTRLDKPARVH